MTAAPPMRVLLVDDDVRVARALAAVLVVQGCACEAVDSPEAAIEAVQREPFDVLVVDYRLGTATGIELLRRLQRLGHSLPCVLITGSLLDLPEADRALAAAVLQKPFPATLLHETVLRAAERGPPPTAAPGPGAEQTLLDAMGELARMRERDGIIEAACRSARALTGAEGATLVLREGDMTHYVGEDAIGPLFKGRRFPINTCLAGYCMLQRRPIRIRDIHADPRVPSEAYLPTFVKSLLVVPIGREDPFGALAAYWAAEHEPTDAEVATLSALATATAAALRNAACIETLERRLHERTQELAATGRELALFTSASAHELSGPLAVLYANAETLLLGTGDRLAPSERASLEEIRSSAVEMSSILTNLLRLSRISAAEPRRYPVDVTRMAEDLAAELRAREPQRKVEWTIARGLRAAGDPELVRLALQNLLDNAWKFTAPREHAHIEVGERQTVHGPALFVRDDGIGFDPAQAGQLFLPFRRLHDRRGFPGTGIGLLTVARIAEKHGGRTWAEGQPDAGATFYLQLERVDSPPDGDADAAAVRAG